MIPASRIDNPPRLRQNTKAVKTFLSPTRLPVDDPQFRYPESRNPYAQKLREQTAYALTDHDAETCKGRWRERFTPARSADTRLTLEIGCNAAHVLSAQAAARPTELFVGLDWKWKAISRGAEKLEKRALTNARLIRGHAERLDYLFAPEEIDTVAVYFPDPWAKKSQLKNRYLTATRLSHFHRLLRPTGTLHIKTDHAGYFDAILEAVEQTQSLWRIESSTRDLHRDHPNPKSLQVPEITVFEGLFIRRGLPIHQIILKKRSPKLL